ncbi:MAG: hypothetical protein U0527_06530 [Candidatus Eisenbacteria bacterium]
MNGCPTILPNDAVVVRVGGEAPNASGARRICTVTKELLDTPDETEAQVG